MPDALEQRIRAHLAELDQAGLRRTLRAPRGIDLSSNDYLGLATHPCIVERLATAVKEFGAGSTGSRLLRGHRDCFEAVEQKFAAFKGTQACTLFLQRLPREPGCADHVRRTGRRDSFR